LRLISAAHALNIVAVPGSTITPYCFFWEADQEAEEDFALFAIGIIGVGFLAVPTLSGSASYALSEALGWKAGLGYTFREARACYVVIALATLVGVELNYVGIPPFRTLYYAAAVNGVLVPPLMATITLVGNNRAIMGRRVNNRFANLMGWGTVLMMGVCALALIGALVFGT
jgi:Mn2+/Fe2+ NRAMP family transporter